MVSTPSRYHPPADPLSRTAALTSLERAKRFDVEDLIEEIPSLSTIVDKYESVKMSLPTKKNRHVSLSNKLAVADKLRFKERSQTNPRVRPPAGLYTTTVQNDMASEGEISMVSNTNLA